jgi:hypothetical protein
MIKATVKPTKVTDDKKKLFDSGFKGKNVAAQQVRCLVFLHLLTTKKSSSQYFRLVFDYCRPKWRRTEHDESKSKLLKFMPILYE